jgi:hypothetical protein
MKARVRATVDGSRSTRREQGAGGEAVHRGLEPLGGDPGDRVPAERA